MSLFTSYSELIEEMRACGDKIWDGSIPATDETPAEFVARLLRAAHDPNPGLVPQTNLWAVVDDRVVGKIGLRHHLNESLRELGGHIGYEVRPSARRQGVATEMLRRVLQLPAARAIGRVLLTCAPDNVGSNKTILACGGVLERTGYAATIARATSYYWIDVR